jgi:succinylarginine dihydrolase
MNAFEINFDGIVGPTHNYAGLSYGNVASMKHKLTVSNPRRAALEGLEKMKFVASLGVKQAVLPPHERPDIAALRMFGISGNIAEMFAAARKTNPTLLARVSSASAMWAANAATVSPSADTADRRVHFTPANLKSTIHRSLEAPMTALLIKRIFHDDSHFARHAPIDNYGDEGAANHTRLWSRDGEPGIEIFTYGRDDSEVSMIQSAFPARQDRKASELVFVLHKLSDAATVFVKQDRRAIDAGAFHNDVVCVGHRNVLLLHALAWENQAAALRQIRERFDTVCHAPLHVIEIGDHQVPLADAVSTYLFNSQIVTLPDGLLALIAPVECREHKGVAATIDRIINESNPISAVHYVDVRQSMCNGGGPACLRIRVMLTDEELAAMHQGVIFTDALYESLKKWINKHYREKLSSEDLADPKLLEESRAALDELSRLLGLGRIYAFQM